MIPRWIKRSSLSMLTMFLLSMVLVACGGSETTSNNGVVTVNWWSWNPGDPLGAQFVEAFNASHDDIKLVYKQSEYNDYVTELKLAMASGTGPDIFGLQAGAMLSEYSPFMEDLAPYAKTTWGDNWKDRFYSFGLDPLTSGEQVTALPFFLSAGGYVWYNKTIFDENNLTPPTTFEEWVEVSKTLQSKGITPFMQGAKDAWVNFDMYIALSNNLAPGKIYQAEAGEIAWTDPDLVKAMDYWKQLFSNGIMQKGALGVSQYPDVNDKFRKGETAMVLFGTWNNSAMTKATLATNKEELGLEKDFEFVPIPFPTISGNPSQLFGGPDVALAMNNASANKEAAWKVLEWMTSEEAQKIHATALSSPAITSVSIDDSDIYTDTQKEALKMQEKDFENVIGAREFKYPELKTALADALQYVATGEQTPQQALEAVEQVSKTIQR